MTMNKVNIYLSIFLFSLILFASCEKSTETKDLSTLTYYAEFEMTGEEVMLIAQNSTYTEPGCKAFENGAEMAVVTEISGLNSGATSMNTAVSDLYTITYTATNSDGFSASVQRQVWVVGEQNLTNSLAGLYRSTVFRNGSSGAQYTNMEYILIWKTADNQYQISDAIGGYYDMGRGYGSGYRSTGLKINVVDLAANSFTFNDPVSVGTFGGNVTVDAMTVDAATNSINLITTWDSGYTFDFTLTQVEF